MKIAELQYWHSFLNYHLFSNLLEPALIIAKTSNNDDENDLLAHIDTNLEPFLITYYFDINNCKDDLFIITVLLHEMAHQYCYENEIEDINENYQHNSDFRAAALEHGLVYDGYKLSQQTEELIKAHLETLTLLKATKILPT